MKLHDSYECGVSIVVISFNTRELLRECLHTLVLECEKVTGDVCAEVLVVDNASIDGSPEMVVSEFSGSTIPVRLICSENNLGFGRANNLALEQAKGRYLVLLNSDAFLHSGALALAIRHMNDSPKTGLGGARLVGRDGEIQPSARCFHSIWKDSLVLSGLASRFPKSRIFGAPDRTWADPEVAADVDWVPGAFLILRREVIAKIGNFDPRFFLYYEETDLCRRAHAAGYAVSYWPDVVVTHIGGESGRQLASLDASKPVSRVELWRMRSTLLYYRKHHGWQAALAFVMERTLYQIRFLRNQNSRNPSRVGRADQADQLGRLMQQAWKDTDGGRVSPPQPW
jgi:GT2 family glycosyltransferase